MMKTTLLALFLAAIGGSALADTPAPAPAAPSATQTPDQLVENSAKRMLVELDANRESYRNDPAKLDALVGNVLLPNFDTDYAARLVLGQNWRTATPDQRKRFVDAFYHSLLRNYGAGGNDGHGAHAGEEGERRQGAGGLQPAQDRFRLEGLGCRHRRHFLRQEFPHRLFLGNSAKGPG